MALGLRARTSRHGLGLSPQASVDRGLAIMAVVWQGLWLVTDPKLWPGRGQSVPTTVLLCSAILTWLAVVVATWGPWSAPSRRVRAQVANLVVLYATAFVLIADVQSVEPDGWRDGASMLNLAVGLTGLLLIARVAVPIAVVAVFAEAAMLVALDLTQLATLSRTNEVLYPLYAFGIAVATIGGRRALLLAARRTERARVDLESAEAHAAAMRKVEQRLREQTRLLHETVLNTLTAISRGGLDDAAVAARIRQRARDSANVLESLATADLRSGDAAVAWLHDVADRRDQSADFGVPLHVDVQGEGELPVEVRAAVVTASREALSNVSRHSGASAAKVTVRIADAGQRLDIEIVDDGRGFDAAAVPGRFGISEAIVRPMAEVGGSASIESTPGSGTTVRLRWASASGGQVRPQPESTTAFVIPVLAAFGMLTFMSLLLTIDVVHSLPLAIGGLAIAIAAAALLIVYARSGSLPAWVVVVVCLTAPLIYRLQVLSLGTGDAGSWADWASEAIVSLMLVVAAAGPWWGWIAALIAWVFTQGDVVTELVQPGTAIIVAGGLFARSVRGNSRLYGDARRQRAVEVSSALSDAESIRRTRERYSALEETGALALLRGIADGVSHPNDPVVRERCAAEERFIRAVMRLDPAANPLHAFASRLAIRAHRRGLGVDIDLADGQGVPAVLVADLESASIAVVDHAIPGEPARLSARLEGEETVVRLVVAVSAADQHAVVAQVQPPLTVLMSPEDSMVMWELRHG